jgi:hypothetical protein
VTAAEVISIIDRGFAEVTHPGDPFLVGSSDGDEPLKEVSAFYGVTDWHTLTSAFLDAHYTALSFFSEGGFRFFLPAYLAGDVLDELHTADPVFHLCHGFSEFTLTQTIDGRTFERTSGRGQFINPRRFGAMTFVDYARYRLSIFTREESSAIVSYLEFVRGRESRASERGSIDEALDRFWRERAASAPTRERLARHVAEEAIYLDAVMRRKGDRR